MNQNLAVTFLHWFVIRAPLEILRIGENFWIFGWQFFSVGFFIPRFFAPWHRDITPYGRGFDLKRILRALLWNLISRLIGAVLRLFVMLSGLAFELFVMLATMLAFVFWFLSPIISTVLIIQGLIGLF
ncbi:MAG: hypothetical protein HY396_02325 [Candidatus Doudnabacteria bacterium]|nr:hypothetical protein [Candidatus Doudnabacteria bacterium]